MFSKQILTIVLPGGCMARSPIIPSSRFKPLEVVAPEEKSVSVSVEY